MKARETPSPGSAQRLPDARVAEAVRATSAPLCRGEAGRAGDLALENAPLTSPNEKRLQLALLELCFERGYAQIQVEDVCERAGLPRADFDACYASLEDCYCIRFSAMSYELSMDIASAVLAASSWREQIRAGAHASCRYWIADIPRANYMLVEAPVVGERARLIRDQGIDAMAMLLDRGRSCLRDPDSLSPATARALSGAVYEETRRLVAARRRPEEIAAAVPKMMFTILLPYLGPEIAAEELSIPPPRSPTAV